MKPLPIRWRLTLWYSVMFATAALLLSVTSWWMLRRTIDATIHHDLQERIDDVRVQLQQVAPDATAAQFQKALEATYEHRDEGKWLQVLGPDGHWLYRSKRIASQSTLLALPAALPAGGIQREFQQGGRTVRALSAPVSANGRSYSVETGVSMAKSHLLLQEFGLGLLLLTPVVLLLAAGAGHFMSRRALLPVAAIAEEARRINERNLNNRLPVSASNDELSDLSATLNHMLARIDSSFRSVRDFTANASHEIRTPLARIRAEAEIALLLPRQLNEYRQSLEKIHDDSMEMSRLIDNLLTLARAESGSEVLRMEPVDLQALISEVTTEWSGIAAALSINLSTSKQVQSAAGDRTMVLGDRTALLRLLRIWLDNACKFTPAGGSITIRSSRLGQWETLAVEDTGVGIAPEAQGRVFERFYRVDIQNVRDRVGAGLGLSLAAWIAEQHKTRINLESALGKGARFEITLRRTQDESARRVRESVKVS